MDSSKKARPQATIFQNLNGPLSKSYSVRDGAVVRGTTAQMTAGRYDCMDVDDLESLMHAIAAGAIGPDVAFAYGVPRPEIPRSGYITTAAAGGVARTAANFVWAEHAPGILMLDFDPAKDGRHDGWKGEDFLEVLHSVAPELADAEVWLTPSASSRVWRAGRPVGNGWRGYVVADSAEAIPLYGATLIARLVAAGHAWIEISASGARLLRTIIDGAVWQSNRLDFVGAPVIDDPELSLEPGAAISLGEAGQHFHITPQTIDMGSDVVKRLMDEARADAEAAGAAWEDNRVASAMAAGMQEADARKLYGRARQMGILDGDFLLYDRDGRGVTVRQVLADPDRWHGAGVRHPLEPDVGGADYTKIYLIGQRVGPMITTRAHGGQEWRLMDSNAVMGAAPTVAAVDPTTEQTIAELVALVHDPIAFEQRLVAAKAVHRLSKTALRRAVAAAVRQAALDNERRVVLVKEAPADNAALWRSSCAPTLVFVDDEFLEWDGAAYRVVSRAALLARIQTWLRAAAVEIAGDNPAQPLLAPFQPTMNDRNEILDALKVGFHVDGADRPMSLRTRLETPDWMAFTNGTLNLRTGLFQPPDADFFTRNACDFPYQQDAPTPVNWLAFLEELFPEMDDRNLLQRMFGYILSGATHLQVMFMLVGPSRGGKGVLTRVLQALIGYEACVSFTLSDLDGSRPFAMQKLVGRSLAISADVHVSSKSDKPKIAEALKTIVGEDMISIPRKHITDWRGRLGCRFWLTANSIPDLPDVSKGLSNRMVTLHLKKSFAHKIDPRLYDDKLSPELPGILKWAVEGMRALEREGRFTLSENAQAARNEFEMGNNPVLAFLEDCCEMEPEALTAKTTIGNAYRIWAAENSERVLTEREFARQLRAAGVNVTRSSLKVQLDGKRVNAYGGVRLKS